MEIDLIFKVAAIGIIVSILNQVLSKSGREEQATMTTLTGLVVVLMIVAEKIAVTDRSKFVTINDIVMQTDYVMYLDFAESFNEMVDGELMLFNPVAGQLRPAEVRK